MCVIFFYVNSNPAPGGCKLILASNRDEFYARETKPVAQWQSAEHVYGGIDLEPGREGGTWLAIGGHNGVYKIGALLNLTGEPKPRNAVGRGSIVADFVKSADNCSIDDYNGQLYADCGKYTAFNFLSIEIGSSRQSPAHVRLLSNVPPTLEHYKEEKCYGFGNSLPHVPFKKVEYGQQRFEAIVDDYNNKLKQQQQQQGVHDPTEINDLQNGLIQNLNDLLKCSEKFWPDPELERRAPNWGKDLSAINVRITNEDYGSRTHTVIIVDENDKMHFVEETMASLNPEGEWLKTHVEKQYFQ